MTPSSRASRASRAGADPRARTRHSTLAIPPAWTDVWVSAEPDGHLQAVGLDEAGRRQYRYHDRWTEARNAEKFDRLAEVGDRLSRVRRAVEHDLRHGDCEHRTVAAMIRLIDQTLGRIGNAESVERFGTRGISTLGPDNVEVSSTTVQLSFRGKGQSDQHTIVIDPDLAHVIPELESAGRECIDDRPTGPQIADAAAEALNNTRSVARESYVHPLVFDAADDDVENAWRSSRSSRWYSRPERTLLKLLHRSRPLLPTYHR